ncbi:MAG: TetR/AcrR family transcriptional regulator [Faecalibacterium sp.]
MYHIKPDKRAQTSATLLYQGLSLCMQEKPFDKITISDLQEASSVSRATFYRNFDTLTDILYWQCDCQFEDFAKKFLQDEIARTQQNGLLLFFFSLWFQNSAILEQLVQIQRIDIILECHTKHSVIISDYYRNQYQLPDVHYDYFMAVRTHMFIGVLLVWLQHGKQETAAQLLDIVHKQIEFVRNSDVYI